MNKTLTIPHGQPLVIVWLENHPKAFLLLHAARRYAKEMGGKWCAAYVETPAALSTLDQSNSEHMLRLCTLTEQMGGEVLRLQANTMEQGLIELLEAQRERLALFIIGSMEKAGRFMPRLSLSPWEQAAHLAGQYTRVEIIPLAGPPLTRAHWNWRNLRQIKPVYFFYALAAVSVAYLAAELLQWALPPALFRINTQNIGLLFMTACAFVAGRYGLLPGLVAAGASFLTYNYFYVAPYYELRIAVFTEALNMAIFLSAGILIALFTSHARSYAENAAKRERSTQALFTLYRIAATAFSRQQALETLQRKLLEMLDVKVAFFLPSAFNPDHLEPVIAPDPALEEKDRQALALCWKEMKTTGLASPLLAEASWRYEPMVAPSGEIGVLAVRPKTGRMLDPWQGMLLTNIADQTAVLIENLELKHMMESLRIREEREKLRAMLLSSVSHDLKTPLAGIIGALSVHRSVGKRLSPERREELLEGALEEAQRLDTFITNILDMTRLESGTVDFRPQWHEMSGVLQRALKRVQHRLRNREVTIHPNPHNIEVLMDAMMTEQVWQNLLDNACKYSPDKTPIEIHCEADAQKGFLCSVRDHGHGIPDDQIDKIFDKYTRLKKEDSQVAGTGLGLSICKAIMLSQGGWITAANHPEGGAVFTFCLPQWRKIPETVQEKQEAVA